MSIAFYVSGGATRLQKALRLNGPELIADTKLIFSDDEHTGSLAELAEVLGISYICRDYSTFQKTAMKSKSESMSDELLRQMKKHGIDYCFSFGAHILKGRLLQEYENKIINFHPSILPMFPGLRSIDQAMDARSNLLGNTAHFIDSGMDTGPIIMQNVVSPNVFNAGGYDAVLDNQLPMLQQIIRWLKANRIIVEGKKVIIKDAQDSLAFFPRLENADGTGATAS